MEFSAEWDKQKWDAFVRRIEKSLALSTIDRVLAATAYKGLKIFTAFLPKKTGAWFVQKKGIGEYQLVSMSKVALFLEEGTRAHGPRTAKFLYIPLRPGAAVWREGFVYGRDYILTKRVKGIRARHYLKPLSEYVLKLMVDDFSAHLAAVGA